MAPNFVDPKASLLGPAVGTAPRPARARVLTLGSTLDPYRRARQGGLRVIRSGYQGLTTWYPPVLRLLSRFPALVCPNSDLLRAFRGENLRV